MHPEHLLADIARIPTVSVSGRVTAVKGLLVEAAGIAPSLSVGSRCVIKLANGKETQCEAVGFREDIALLMPFDTVEGIGTGAEVTLREAEAVIRPNPGWLGRVVNAFGEPIDGKGPLPQGEEAYALRATPPPARDRNRVAGKLDLGIRAMNVFLTCCLGQRMGIFAGSGVGKSILLSMLARYSQASVNVIGLVGERGREVKEFLEDDLGEEGLARSVVVVATSSESALMRRQAAYTTLAISEFFRDQQHDVLCLMDSVTRFAMAQREIGLSAGEPPTSKGYTPTVFSELPRLLERAGPGVEGQGSITGLFTVLVEGDDTNEPVSDAVRGILDGHIVLDRAIAQRGRYPSIDILKSVSRTIPDCNDAAENRLIESARRYLASYENMAEMIRLGAYRRGSDPEVDQAMQFYPAIEGVISQRIEDSANLEDSYDALAGALQIQEWRTALSDEGVSGHMKLEREA